MACCFEHDNEVWGSVKNVNFLVRLFRLEYFGLALPCELSTRQWRSLCHVLITDLHDNRRIGLRVI